MWQEPIETAVRARCSVAGLAVDSVVVDVSDATDVQVTATAGEWYSTMHCGPAPSEFWKDWAEVVAAIVADAVITAARSGK